MAAARADVAAAAASEFAELERLWHEVDWTCRASRVELIDGADRREPVRQAVGHSSVCRPS